MNSTDYTGVQYVPRLKKWHSRVTHKGIVYNCGHHDTSKEAAIARDIKILEKNLPFKLQVLKPKK